MQNPNFSFSVAATPPYVLAGTLMESMPQGDPPRPSGYVYRTRAAVAGVWNATQGGAFDGVDDLGIRINGADFVPPAPSANLAAWIAAMNGIALLATLGAVVSTTGGTNVRVTGPANGAALVLAPVQPDTPDLTLSAFTPSTAPVAAPDIRPGMGVVFQDYNWYVEAPLPTSPIARFAGVVTRDSLQSDDIVLGLSGAVTFPRKLIDENPAQVARKGRITLLAATGAVVTADAPVYMGRLPTEAGYFYAEDDGGNTRLLIPGACWAQAGTGDATAERGFLALFL